MSKQFAFVVLGWAMALVCFAFMVNYEFTHAENHQPTIIRVRVNGYDLINHRWEYEGE